MGQRRRATWRARPAVCRFLADSLTLACCLMLAHGTYRQVSLAMVDHTPVTGLPLGLVQSALLISSIGMALVLAWNLWRLLTGRMKANELAPYSGSVGE